VRQSNAFELAPVDLASTDLEPFVGDCDAIFHLAGEPGVRTSWDGRFELFLRRNVLATQRLLDAACRTPEKPFVYASSSSIYGDAETLPTGEDAPTRPFSPYGATKLAAENLCRIYHANHGLRTVALRYFTVYGPRQRPDMAFHRFCRAAATGAPLTVFGDGRQTRDFTFVGDIVAATRAAAESPTAAGRAYNVGGGSRVSVREALELLEEFAGRPLDVRYEDSQRGDVRHTGADTTRARADLGFAPATAFERGLEAEFLWMRDLEHRRRRIVAPPATARVPRFLFHSNEIVGLGHLRRALAIAGNLGDDRAAASSLILSGSPIAPFFALPDGVDTVKLPARARSRDGAPQPPSLALGFDELRDLRASLAQAATDSFAPDVVVVDKVPLGLEGELGPVLRSLAGNPAVKVVLGLRDIDDSAERVRRKWRPELRAAIERYFDAVLVYGPRSSPDALDCLGWDDLPVPVHHVGYLGMPMPTTGPEDLPPGYVLATAGGGHDGIEMLEAFAGALRRSPLPCRAVIVAGPLMVPADVARLRELTAGLDAEVHPFRTDMDRVIAGARGVVSMAGYNTVAELMRARKPALLVPRVRPSEEQLVRASELARNGLQEMLHPDVMTADTMAAALQRLLARTPPAASLLDHRGSERAGEILWELAAGGATTTAAPEPALALQA
jgi:predicted glycosyltransferase/nucleoside-diphosphate-sugar epimerase